MPKVTIYTSVLCPYCHMAKELLRAKCVPFDEVDVTGKSALRAEMSSKAEETSAQASLVAVLFSMIADSDHGNEVLRQLVGVALLMSVGVSIVRLRLRRFAERNAHRPVHLTRRRRIAITVVGLVVGVLVGLTSVGSGTLIAASLIMLFPSMLPSRLVGTDLVQTHVLEDVGD